MGRKRVLIVEDSAVVRELITSIIAADSRLEVAAAVGSAEEALALLPGVAPDVISMDVRLPGMNGFEATKRIMTERPTPVVIVSAALRAEDLRFTMQALHAGALSVLERPAVSDPAVHAAFADRLCTRLATMTEVQLVRQRSRSTVPPGRPLREGTPDEPVAGRRFRALGIAASTGGPRALATILGDLGAAFPLPILVVQHIGAPFLESFVSWLGELCPLETAIARKSEKLRPGRVYVAGPDRHLEISRGRLRSYEEPPVGGVVPSASVLFRSMARDLGPASLAVLLTGMGEDGASGLLEIRRAGGHTITENASTAVVHGMPGTAERLGASCESLPLHRIGERVRQLTVGPTEGS